MKKRLFLVMFLIVSFIFLFSIISAALNDSNTEEAKIDKAYDCLTNKVKDKCPVSLEESIFTALAIEECGEVIKNNSRDNVCWPKESCNIGITAKAILAMKKTGSSTEKAEEWLISQNRTSSNLIWYLEIESTNPTTCSISYSGQSYSVSIGSDKKISSGAGSCLSPSESNYWLKINPSCYASEFTISCTESFLTTLLYKKESSS
ncbi:MAG: hypothetical protein AABW81_00350, partial [Nanoarchaeota archaeon]